MATSLAFTNSVDVTDAATFIPEVWSDEIIAAYKANEGAVYRYPLTLRLVK